MLRTHMYMHRRYTHSRLMRCLFRTWTYKHAWPGGRHHYMCTGCGSQWVVWPGLSKLSDLEQAPPLASVPPLHSEGVGSAHLERQHLPVPGSQESSWIPCRVQGRGWCAPWAQPWAGSLPDTRLGCCFLGHWALDQGGLGPVLPITLSVKVFWEGVLTDPGVHPPPELH